MVVRRRLRALERYLRALRALRRRGRDAFLADEAVQAQAERNAQLLAQTCADTAVHILAATGEAAPETYADAVRGVAPVIGLSRESTEQLGRAVGLRNILVHMYLDVDHGRLFDELGWIEETERFARAVEAWLSGAEASGGGEQG